MSRSVVVSVLVKTMAAGASQPEAFTSVTAAPWGDTQPAAKAAVERSTARRTFRNALPVRSRYAVVPDAALPDLGVWNPVGSGFVAPVWGARGSVVPVSVVPVRVVPGCVARGSVVLVCVVPGCVAQGSVVPVCVVPGCVVQGCIAPACVAVLPGMPAVCRSVPAAARRAA